MGEEGYYHGSIRHSLPHYLLYLVVHKVRRNMGRWLLITVHVFLGCPKEMTSTAALANRNL